jgi:hypothetical protein
MESSAGKKWRCQREIHGSDRPGAPGGDGAGGDALSTEGSTMILVRVNSHRARERLYRLLGKPARGYFSFRFKGEFREVPESKIVEALKIKGISKTRRKLADLSEYW